MENRRLVSGTSGRGIYMICLLPNKFYRTGVRGLLLLPHAFTRPRSGKLSKRRHLSITRAAVVIYNLCCCDKISRSGAEMNGRRPLKNKVPLQ